MQAADLPTTTPADHAGHHEKHLEHDVGVKVRLIEQHGEQGAALNPGSPRVDVVAPHEHDAGGAGDVDRYLKWSIKARLPPEPMCIAFRRVSSSLADVQKIVEDMEVILVELVFHGPQLVDRNPCHLRGVVRRFHARQGI